MRQAFCLAVLLFTVTYLGFAQSTLLKKAEALSQTRPDSALMLLRKIHADASDNGDQVNAGLSLQYMGRICYYQGHYAQAIDFYQHADRIFEEANATKLLAANLNEMGILYYYNKQQAKSRQLYNKALKIYQSTGDRIGQADVYGNIGHLLEKQRLYDSAYFYQRKAQVEFERAGNAQGLAKIYENLGSIYEDKEQYDSAYVHFNKSIQLYNGANNLVNRIEVINNLGDVLRKTGKYRESLNMSYKALQIATKTGNLYQMASACRDLGKAYQLLNQLDSAYHYVELSRWYSIEVYSKDGIVQTAFLQVLYEINKKSNEINRLNNARKVNRVMVIAGVAVVALLIVLSGVVLSRQRLKLKDQKELLTLEQKNKRLQEESYKQQLELKSKELSTHTLNLIQNNQVLENLRNTLQQMVKDDKRDQKKQLQQVINNINQSFNHEQHWREFTRAFEQVHQPFLDKLKSVSQDLTAADLRLIALLKVNMDSKDIAGLLGISADSLRVSRYRLRKKLNLEQGDNLSSFVQNL